MARYTLQPVRHDCEKMLGSASPLDLRAGDRRALGAAPGQPSRRNFTHLASSTPMHVIRADHELAAAQPSLGSRREVLAT
jgi:hypothetical protein